MVSKNIIEHQSVAKHCSFVGKKKHSSTRNSTSFLLTQAAKWHHTSRHCPNLVPNEEDLDLFPYLEDLVPVQIKYPEKAEHWDSLAHLWSDWYGQYFHADFPRLIVRFEDLLFNTKEMIQTVCACVGGVPREEGKFAYVVDSGKFGKGHPETGAKHTVSFRILTCFCCSSMENFWKIALVLKLC